MPRVPVTPQVRQEIRPGYRLDAAAPSGAFGGGRPLAHNVAQANDVIDAQRKAIFEDDFHEAVKAMTSLKAWENQSGYRDVLGENTKGLGAKMQEGYRAKVSEIATNLKSERQRAIFQQKASENELGFTEGVDNHVRRQMGIAKAQAVDAFVSTWQDSGIAAGSSGNTAGLESAVREIDGARRVWGEQNGIPPVAIERMIREDSSRVYAGAITSMLDAKNDLAAKDAFVKYGDQLTAQDKARLERMVKQESTLGESQRWADVVLSYDPETLQDALKHLDKLAEQEKLTPEVRQGATSLTSQRFAVLKEARREAYLNDLQEAEAIIEQKADIRAIPAELREKLRRADISALERRAQDILTRNEPVTDWKRYTALRDLAANPDTRKDFLDTPPMAYRNHLSNAEFKEIVGLRAGLLKGDEKSKKQIEGYRTLSESIRSALDVAGFTKDADPRERDILEQIMDEEIRHFRAMNKGEDPAPEEVQKKVTQLVTKAKVNGKFFDQYGYKTTLERLEQADTVVPPEERKAIEDEMRRQGITPTRRGIIDAYEAKQKMKPYERWLPK